MTEDELKALGQNMLTYCHKFSVPLDYLFEILEDQKVTPMIRGKAMEYNAYLMLKLVLSPMAWDIQKLNLNAQTGAHDEDISITHRRTGVILKVESKSAVRGSYSIGKRSRGVWKDVSHFKVKCHRSRSSIALASTSNDRYSVDSFDVIITNTTNAIFQANTVSEGLEILHDPLLRLSLMKFYNVEDKHDLILASGDDWRFAIPKDIAEDGFIPRTPYVLMHNDPNWRPLNELEVRLLKVVNEKRKTHASSRRN